MHRKETHHNINVLYDLYDKVLYVQHLAFRTSLVNQMMSELSALGFKGQNIGTMSRAGLIFFISSLPL